MVILMKFSDLSSLVGRRALITGSAGFLGRTFADTLADLGADLILIDRPGSELTKLSDALKSQYDVKVNSFSCDFENSDSRIELINKIKKLGISLDILINNAAFVGSTNLDGWNTIFEKQTIDTWRKAFEINLTSAFELSQGLLPLLKQSPNASIINIASIYGTLGPDWSLYTNTNMANPAAYSVSKGGLIQLTKWLSTTLAPEVRVNSISPGGIFRNQHQDFVERYSRKTPMARMANEEDFRGVIGFLASDLSSYVTGQNICIDGGWSAW